VVLKEDIIINTDSCFTISQREVITDRSTQQLSKCPSK